jgi:hypothetical protein
VLENLFHRAENIMSTQKLHFRPLFLVIFTIVLLVSAVLSTLQAQEGLVPLPGASARDFTEIQVLEAPSGYIAFGYSVAADGDLLVVGARMDDDIQTEVVLVYHRNSSGVWVYESTLVSDDYYEGDSFGATLAISGNIVMVGAPNAEVFAEPDDSEFDQSEGAAYFFERGSVGNWTQVAMVHGTASGQDYFSQDIALDGNFASGVDNNTRSGSEIDGTAHFFERIGSGTWDWDGVIMPPFDYPSADYIDIKGNLAVLTAGDNFNNVDYLIILERMASAWVTNTTLSADTGTYFGNNELLDNTLFVQKFASMNGVSVYKNTGGTWSETQTLLPDSNNFYFGTSMDSEIELLAIGNPNDTNQAGAVYLFTWNGSDWLRHDKIVESESEFGNSVALSNGTLFVGSEDRFDDTLGSVFIYEDVPPTTPEPTDDPTSGPSATPIPVTQTPVPPTSTSETTPDPTSEQTPEVDGQVLADGGFEQQLTGWTLKNGSSDKLKCNKPEKVVAYEGLCAFQFKGQPGENAKLSQTVSGVQAGDTLALSGYAKAKGSNVSGKVKVVVIYADGVTPESKITVHISSPTGVYLPLSSFQPVLTTTVVAAPSKVKLSIKNKGKSGKVLYDALSLMAQ